MEPAVPEVLRFASPSDPRPPPSGQSSGRRRALAEWLVRPDHPLTSRVLVNRLWHYHFGRGIVKSTSDFGLQGDHPTHPELLDWLASELVAGGWQIKPIQRMIVLSATYRMSSAATPNGLAADPENHFLWRRSIIRLTAEQLRDGVLAVNGRLHRQLGGPSVYPTIPRAVLQGQSRPGAGWGSSTPADQARRSVYVFVKRSLPVPLMAAFDAPDTDFSCPARFATTQPTQALLLLNSEELNHQADHFAAALTEEFGAASSQLIAAAFERSLGRPPTDPEVVRGGELLRSLQEEFGMSHDGALRQVCLMILNLNEFLYVD